jgi:hypothetical protein
MWLDSHLPRKKLLTIVSESFGREARRYNMSNTIVTVEAPIEEKFIMIQLTCGLTPWVRISKGHYITLYQSTQTGDRLWAKMDETPNVFYMPQIPVETTEELRNILIFVKTELGI